MTEHPSTKGPQAEALRLANALDGGKLIDDSTEWADTLARAAELLRHYAHELQDAHTSRSAPDDWTGGEEAKAAYDEHLAVAEALERERADAMEQARLLGISAERELRLCARVQGLERAAPQWVPVAEHLPATGTPVLLDIGKRLPIRAMWAAKHTVEAPPEQVDIDWGDYDEATDTYYSPEGWYEWNEYEECHWFVHDVPRAWMALPEQDRDRGAKGESNE